MIKKNIGGIRMDQDQKMLQLLERLENANRKQVLYARAQFIFTVVAAISCVVLLLIGMKVLPRLQEAAVQAETVLQNLETVTTELAKSDLSGMVENVDTLVSNVDGLVTSSQAGVEQTLEKIKAIDFDALNDAIKDLSDVIDPIAKFFNKYKIG